MNSDDILIAKNAYLWIYSAKTGQLQCFSNIDIYQYKLPYSDRPLNQYNAINKDTKINRLVNGIEYGVWYYPRRQQYLIWGRKLDSELVKSIFVKAVRQKSKEKINESLIMLKKEHDILETLSSSLLTNCVVSVKNYDDVKTVIDQYFINL